MLLHSFDPFCAKNVYKALTEATAECGENGRGRSGLSNKGSSGLCSQLRCMFSEKHKCRIWFILKLLLVARWI